MSELPTTWCEVPIRVRYSETDAMGFLHHANYIIYFENSRIELFRATGGNYRSMEERGFFLVVVSVECKYKRPARYDDELIIKVRLVRWSGAKLIHEYEIRRGDDLIATGQTVIACLNREGEVQRMSLELLYPEGMIALPESNSKAEDWVNLPDPE